MCNKCGVNEATIILCKRCAPKSYKERRKTVKASTPVQQLKAEIAACATELSSLSRSDIYNSVHDVIAEKLRQLSAV